MFKKVSAVLTALLLLLSLCSCGARAERHVSLEAMDTFMDLRLFDAAESAAAEAEDLIRKLDALFSATDEKSEIFRLNHGEKFQASDETLRLLRRSLELCAETGGALDLSVYPLVRAWGFTTGNHHVPDADELSALLRKVGYEKIGISDGGQIDLPEGTEIDFGSVAKGYVGDRLAEILHKNNVHSALLALGGNIHTVGSKPDGSPWRIAVQDPKNPEGDFLGVVAVRDRAVVTSGGYQRFFTGENGEIYWHIIDPATGLPAKNGVISATVIAEEGTLCDALSTALFVMGPERAAGYWRNHPGFDMVLVTDDGRVLISGGLAGSFELADGSPYVLSVLSR